MSKSSTVTVRETPVEAVARATTGGLVIHGENFVIDTDERLELVDLTDRVMEYVRKFDIKEGMITLWSMHTTCSVFINEFQKALLTDILTYHVVAGKVMAADVVKMDGKSAKTVQGTDVKISTTGGVKLNGTSNVVKTDIECSNGVIHVIDSVILPS